MKKSMSSKFFVVARAVDGSISIVAGGASVEEVKSSLASSLADSTEVKVEGTAVPLDAVIAFATTELAAKGAEAKVGDLKKYHTVAANGVVTVYESKTELVGSYIPFYYYNAPKVTIVKELRIGESTIPEPVPVPPTPAPAPEPAPINVIAPQPVTRMGLRLTPGHRRLR